MGIRMSGIVSGLDTEGIIKELMAAKSLKKTKIEGNKTKLEWKQEKWAELNTKLYKLYTDYASKLSLPSNYNLKKASSSNENIATIKANSNAANGSYELEVMELATSQYVTGGKVGSGFKNSSKLTELGVSLGTEIKITNGSKTINFQVKAGSKISDFVQALKDAGLNANFDEGQQRFFISSKESGAENRFTITANKLSSNEMAAREALEEAIKYDQLSNSDKAVIDQIYEVLANGSEGETEYDNAKNKLISIAEKYAESSTTTAATNYVKATLYDELVNDPDNAENLAGYQIIAEKSYYDYDDDGEITAVKVKAKEDILKSLKEEAVQQLKDEGQNYRDQSLIDAKKAEIIAAYGDEAAYIQAKVDEKVEAYVDKRITSDVNNLLKEQENKDKITRIKNEGIIDDGIIGTANQTEYDGLSEKAKELFSVNAPFYGCGTAKSNAETAVSNAINHYTNSVTIRSDGAADITGLGLGEVKYVTNDEGVEEIVSGFSGMSVVGAKDSLIKLNGAELTSSNTSVIVNGLTIDLKAKTEGTGPITFSVSNDAESAYNMVKDFLKQYNEIMSEMNTLLRAKSARGYEPLTDEEKEAMSEKQIELWEDKIKSALFRNDDRLNSVASSMRNAMMSSVEVDGKKYSLSSLGIMTSSDYTENGLLHIYGDKDDAIYAGMDDKLMKMFTEDPDLASKILGKVVGNLKDTMFDQMKSSKISSALTFYNDKQMNKLQDNYKEEISLWEKRLQAMEDRYYKQFTALEKAMSKLNSQGNYFANLMGN